MASLTSPPGVASSSLRDVKKSASLTSPPGYTISPLTTSHETRYSSRAANAKNSLVFTNPTTHRVTSPVRNGNPVGSLVGASALAPSFSSIQSVTRRGCATPRTSLTYTKSHRSGPLPTNAVSVEPGAGASCRIASPATRTASPLRGQGRLSMVVDCGVNASSSVTPTEPGICSPRLPSGPLSARLAISSPRSNLDGASVRMKGGSVSGSMLVAPSIGEVDRQTRDPISVVYNTTKLELQKFALVLKNELRHEIVEYVTAEMQNALKQEMQRLEKERAPREEKLQTRRVDNEDDKADTASEQQFVTSSVVAALTERLDTLKAYCEERLLAIETVLRSEITPAITTIVTDVDAMKRQFTSLQDMEGSGVALAKVAEKEGNGGELVAMLAQERMVTDEALTSTRIDLLTSMQDIASSLRQRMEQKLHSVVDLLPVTQESAKVFIQSEFHFLREAQTAELAEQRKALGELDVRVVHLFGDVEFVINEVVKQSEILQSLCVAVKLPKRQ